MTSTILIADDDAIQRRLLEAMVRRFGYHAELAEGGEAAAPGGEEALNAEKVKQEQLKTAMIEFKLQIAQRKGEMELAIQQAKADQNLALNDLKGAEMVQKKMRYPQSDYSNRR